MNKMHNNQQNNNQQNNTCCNSFVQVDDALATIRSGFKRAECKLKIVWHQNRLNILNTLLCNGVCSVCQGRINDAIKKHQQWIADLTNPTEDLKRRIDAMYAKEAEKKAAKQATKQAAKQAAEQELSEEAVPVTSSEDNSKCGNAVDPAFYEAVVRSAISRIDANGDEACLAAIKLLPDLTPQLADLSESVGQREEFIERCNARIAEVNSAISEFVSQRALRNKADQEAINQLETLFPVVDKKCDVLDSNLQNLSQELEELRSENGSLKSEWVKARSMIVNHIVPQFAMLRLTINSGGNPGLIRKAKWVYAQLQACNQFDSFELDYDLLPLPTLNKVLSLWKEIQNSTEWRDQLRAKAEKAAKDAAITNNEKQKHRVNSSNKNNLPEIVLKESHRHY